MRQPIGVEVLAHGATPSGDAARRAAPRARRAGAAQSNSLSLTQTPFPLNRASLLCIPGARGIVVGEISLAVGTAGKMGLKQVSP